MLQNSKVTAGKPTGGKIPPPHTHTHRLGLRVLWLQNVIYFSIIAMSKKSNFTIFATENFVQNMNVFVSSF